MNQRHRQVDYRVVLSIASVVIMTFLGYLIWYHEIFPSPALDQPFSWRGVTPGQTTLTEALDILGYPDEFDYRKGYRTYLYEDRNSWGWHAVELWAEKRNDSFVVIGVALGLRSDSDSANEVQTLEQAVTFYGQPDKVTWSMFPYRRILVWARKGIAADVGTRTDMSAWQDLGVSAILIFEPMGIRKFMHTAWSWPSRSYAALPATHNLYADTDAPDTLPENPYDWEEILTTIP